MLSSNKVPMVYEKVGEVPDIGILLYRMPLQWVTSRLMHKAKLVRDLTEDNLNPSERDVCAASQVYANAWDRIMNWVGSRRVPSVALSWDGFCRSPEPKIPKLCSFFGVPQAEIGLDPGWPVHHIRGNAGPGGGSWRDRPIYEKNHREFSSGLTLRREPDERWKRALTHRHCQIVMDICEPVVEEIECRFAGI
jgi:hypothetical protein